MKEIVRFINQESSNPTEFFRLIRDIFSTFGPQQVITFFAEYYNTYLSEETQIH